MPSTAKVGFLIVVFVVLVVAGFAVLGRTVLGARSDDYYADFPDAGGVEQGTAVQMAGVQVGIVHRVHLRNPQLARVTLRLNKGTEVPDGTSAIIPATLIGLGDNPVELMPPPAPSGGYTFLEPGSILDGKLGSPLDNVLPNADQTVTELNRTMAAVRRYLEDDRLRNGFARLLQSSDKTIQQVGRLTSALSDTLESNQTEVRETVRSARATMDEVRRSAAAVARLAEDPRLRDNAVGITNGLRRTTQRAEQLVASIGRLVDDPRLRGPLNRTAASVARLADTAEGIAANLEKASERSVRISANLEETSQSGVRVAKDVERMAASGARIAGSSEGLPARLDEVLVRAAAVEAQLETLLARVNALLPASGKRSPGPSLAALEVEATLMRETDPGHTRVDVDLRYPLRDAALHFGIYDAFESNRLTLQYGSPLSAPIGYRYGLYAGKPGVGVDFRPAPRLGIRGDLWDLNDPRFDLRAHFDFGGGVVGWLGVDRVFKDNAPTIGIGIRR